MESRFMAESKEKLEAEKKRLEDLLSHVARKETKTADEEFTTKFPNMGDDEESNTSEVELYEANLGEERALEQRLHKVNSALKRIGDGTYGVCAVGGEPIEEARLRVAPEADVCVKHSS